MIEIRAPAKINLYLHITGRRPDGYHLLDSLVAFADAGDDLRLMPGDRYSLTVDGPFAHQLAGTPVAGNLVTRAAQALAHQLGRPLHADIRLTKNLPIASGIGGGSADAAATLIGLCRLWIVDPAPRLLEPIAKSLGQDIPACLTSTPAQFVGIGDTTRPAPALPPAWLVLVNPGAALSTPSVFDAYRRQTDAFSLAAPLELPSDFEALADGLRDRHNDLQPAAVALMPEIASVLNALAACEACGVARMTGSGATCFGLFPSAASANLAAVRLARAQADWWVTVTTWYRRHSGQS